jgi:hypothetical protein
MNAQDSVYWRTGLDYHLAASVMGGTLSGNIRTKYYRSAAGYINSALYIEVSSLKFVVDVVDLKKEGIHV